MRPSANHLIQKLSAYSDAEVTAALATAGAARLQQFLTQVQDYQMAPRPSAPPAPQVIWQAGTTRLLDYGAFCPDVEAALPLFIIPSLVNRMDILDLTTEVSFVRWLAARGVRCFVVDWQAPGVEEEKFGLADYILQRLKPMLEVVTRTTQRPPVGLGYCMGGLLLAGLLSQVPTEAVAGQMFLATPWDFAAGFAHLRPLYQTAAPLLERYFQRHATLAVEMLQMLFLSLDPLQVPRKFLALPPEYTPTPRFVALEDWLNNGVPLAGPVAQQCLVDWYGHNAPAAGTWQVGQMQVRPQDFAAPSLVVVPQQDRIVPPASALPLGQLLPMATTLQPELGHIGLMTSRRAEELVWQPILDWLQQYHSLAPEGGEG